MKAVIWTDVIQASVMFLGLILSIIFGISLEKKTNENILFEKHRFDRYWRNFQSISNCQKWRSTAVCSVCEN